MMSGPIAISAGLTFAAYIMGMLSIGILNPPVYHILRWIVRMPIRIFFGVVRLPAHILFVLEVLTWKTRAFSEMLERVSVWSEDVETRMTDWYNDNIVPRFLRSPLIRAQEVTVRTISRRILDDEQYRDAVISHFTGDDVDMFIRRLGSGRVRYEASFQRRRLDRLSPEERTLDEEGIAEIYKRRQGQRFGRIRKRLSDELDHGYGATAEALVEAVVDVDRHASDIVAETRLVPERIVGERQATYERWDRLKAEAEFRLALAPPLIAVAAVLIARQALTWPYGLLCMVIPLVIFLQGVSKEFQAAAQLIQLLEASVVRAAPIERLTTTDLYWNR